MLCRHPYVNDRTGEPFASRNPRDWLKGVPFRCGKCLACRVSTRREWTTRLILEMLGHDRACFVTLTYAEEHCPVTDTGYRTLSLRDFQLFMKKFRTNLERFKKRKYPLRFFACGEYGSRFTQRPHYHVIIFGASDNDRDVILALNNAWSVPAKGGLRHGETEMLGNVTISPLNSNRVAYVAGYHMKKLITPKKVHKIIVSSKEVGSKRYTYEKRVLDRSASRRDENGILGEFRTMSRMPGLGSGMLGRLVALYKSNSAFRHVLNNTGDVPSVVRAFGRNLFLDRFLKNKLREMLNITPDPTAYFADVRDQFFAWLDDRSISHASDFYTYLVAQDDQKFKQLQERIKRQLSKREKF